MNRLRPFLPALISVAVAIPLIGCNTVLTHDYEAVAVTTYIWQVEYTGDPNKTHDREIKRFASTSLVNHNGLMPDDAVTGPDDQGLWWPALPPRPTVDEMEDHKGRSHHTIGTPELIKQVEYTITYEADGRTITSPTDYAVYRQAVRAYRDERPLELVLGLGNGSVQQARAR
jgi:hypothetical protein